MPISPARTPRRAVRGWLSHLSERINNAAATRYESVPSQELPKSASLTGVAANSPKCSRRLFTIGRLPAEHFQHAVGDPETADNVRRGRNHAEHAKNGDEAGVLCGRPFRHHLNCGND